MQHATMGACKKKCGKAYRCRKTRLKYSSVCQHCNGETCDNVFDILGVLEDEEIENDLLSLQPMNIELQPDDEIVESFSTETEPRLGPSKKPRLN
ncbi:hypothetical protein PV328_007843 [Microctonus aethiopoides]|uniref:Uncharacterized protein n=1 Tax=Microctonus aethiopoides TaxID=144406 RepID=A0AA39C9Q9_9HYME|nr:hypothetical protein PV328_007843 [Microctonus aethiopoides]